MNNMFISYDLHAPAKNYERVINQIKSLGGVPVLKSLWFVKSYQPLEAVAKSVWSAMDSDDSLIVVDSTNNNAYWYNLNQSVSKHLVEYWRK